MQAAEHLLALDGCRHLGADELQQLDILLAVAAGRGVVGPTSPRFQ